MIDATTLDGDDSKKTDVTWKDRAIMTSIAIAHAKNSEEAWLYDLERECQKEDSICETTRTGCSR